MRGKFLKGSKKPIKDRYIVTLKSGVEVDGAVDELQRRFGGKLLGTMKHAMKGFGVKVTEQQARAISLHPLVEMVEQDEEMELSSSSSFSFAAVATRSAHPRLSQQTLANDCPWTGSYYLCTYNDENVHWYWNLNRLDNQGYINGTQRTYGYNTTGQGVRVYVVDTGVYANHQEFDSRVEVGASMTADPDTANNKTRDDEEYGWPIDNAPANNPCNGWRPTLDTASHGTSVASIIGGTNTGVAKNVTIVPVKVISCDGWGSKLAVARGLDWIQVDMADADHNPANGLAPRSGPAVVNMSIFVDPNNNTYPTQYPYTEGQQVCEDGLGGYTNCLSAIENEINELVLVDLNASPARRGIPVVVSANNQSNDTCTTSPARMGYSAPNANYQYPTYYRTITVGASMSFPQNGYVDRRWECAQTPEGCNPAFPDLGSNYGPCVSIFAPGWSIHSAAGTGADAYRPDGAGSSGTSFSAAMVTGAVARLLQAQPTLTSTQVWDELVLRTGYRWTSDDFDSHATRVNSRLLYMSAFE